jgi:hypothetical protein
MSNSSHGDLGNKDQREETFDAHYKKLISAQERLERVNIVTETLKKRYEDYQETREFVDFLKSIEEVFAHAEKELWSVERTQDELIKSEIYLLSRQTGVEEDIFAKIYDEFKDASHNVEKIQDIANRLMEKYATEDEAHAKECHDFIMYVRDSLLVFAHAISGKEAFDEITEAKEQIIHLRMESMAADNKPPLNILQNIYSEFKQALVDSI